MNTSGTSGLAIPPYNLLYGNGYSAGARTHTNSWGSIYSGTGYYNGQDADTYLYSHTDVIIFFAAGNSGTNGAYSISCESSGKSIVSVGSSQSAAPVNGKATTQNISSVSWFSSQGPTYDQRIKPDIVITGDPLMSAKSNGNLGQSCATVEKIGTSMASPAAAGSALLIRQYFMDTRFWSFNCNQLYSNCGPLTPSGVLVKAIILHSGSRMLQYSGTNSVTPLGPPPDSVQGYGRITFKNVLPIKSTYPFDLFVDDLNKIGQNSKTTYSVTIPISGNTAPLK